MTQDYIDYTNSIGIYKSKRCSVLGFRFKKEADAIIRNFPSEVCKTRRFLASAENYINEIECFVPTEIIRDHTYQDSLKKVLSLIKETFRPDEFDGIEIFEQDFMDWLLDHQNELNSRLSWKQVCELQCNYGGWKLAKLIFDIPEKTFRQMWNYSDEKQMEEFLKLFSEKATK